MICSYRNLCRENGTTHIWQEWRKRFLFVVYRKLSASRDLNESEILEKKNHGLFFENCSAKYRIYFVGLESSLVLLCVRKFTYSLIHIYIYICVKVYLLSYIYVSHYVRKSFRNFVSNFYDCFEEKY